MQVLKNVDYKFLVFLTLVLPLKKHGESRMEIKNKSHEGELFINAEKTSLWYDGKSTGFRIRSKMKCSPCYLLAICPWIN